MTRTSIRVVYTNPGGEGYLCVLYMAKLAARLLGAELIVVPSRHPSLGEKLRGILGPQKREHSAYLLICPAPTDLNSILSVPDWRSNHGRVVGWVFDSFWTSHIPQWVRWSRVFDHIFVTEGEDLATWRRATRASVDWLPWGSDVLDLGSPNPAREFDLLRFGRQPEEWEEDASNALECESRGLSYHGRPTSFDDPADNERGLMQSLSGAKFALAFTNRVSRSIQTHPGREYITGRWTDALASGTTVAGIPPRSESVQTLLWPEALLDVGTVKRAEGLEAIAAAARTWTRERARLNYAKSLERLDWRWRFKKIAEALEVQPPLLDLELARLREAMQISQATEALG